MDLGLQDGLLHDLDTTVTQPDEVAATYREALSKLSGALPPHPNRPGLPISVPTPACELAS
jgi:hypothetical protein